MGSDGRWEQRTRGRRGLVLLGPCCAAQRPLVPLVAIFIGPFGAFGAFACPPTCARAWRGTSGSPTASSELTVTLARHEVKLSRIFKMGLQRLWLLH